MYMPPKKDKKKVLKQKQKQSQRQSVVVNITAPTAPKKRRPRRKRDVETKEKSHQQSQQSQPQMLYQRPHTFFTAPAMPPIQQAIDIKKDLPLSFYDTNRPMNMGFNFNRPVVEPIATQTEIDLIPTLQNQTDDNLDVVNNIAEDFGADDSAMRTPVSTPIAKEIFYNAWTGRRNQVGASQHKKFMKKGLLDEYGNVPEEYLDKNGKISATYREAFKKGEL